MNEKDFWEEIHYEINFYGGTAWDLSQIAGDKKTELYNLISEMQWKKHSKETITAKVKAELAQLLNGANATAAQ